MRLAVIVLALFVATACQERVPSGPDSADPAGDPLQPPSNTPDPPVPTCDPVCAIMNGPAAGAGTSHWATPRSALWPGTDQLEFLGDGTGRLRWTWPVQCGVHVTCFGPPGSTVIHFTFARTGPNAVALAGAGIRTGLSGISGGTGDHAFTATTRDASGFSERGSFTLVQGTF